MQLIRSAAPEFAAGLQWGAWERALRIGQEAARLAGEVGEEAYFHHELGVLALCSGHPERARTELEASIGMRGALADRQGGLVGRRTLALVEDRTGGALLPAPARRATVTRSARGSAAAARRAAHAMPPGTVATPVAGAALDKPVPGRRRQHRRPRALVSSRRNLAAAGAGAMLAAVLGTIVTLGTTSDRGAAGAMGDKTAAAQTEDNGLPADRPTEAGSTSTPQAGNAQGTAFAPGVPQPGEPGTTGSLPTPHAPGSTSPADDSPGSGSTNLPTHGSSGGSTASDPADPSSPSDPATTPTDPSSGPTDPTDPSDPPSTSPPPSDTSSPSPTVTPTGSTSAPAPQPSDTGTSVAPMPGPDTGEDTSSGAGQ